MNRSFVEKLWNASPASLIRAVKRRLTPKSGSRWFTVTAGPLKNSELFLPDDTGAWGEMISGKFDSFIYDEIAQSGGLKGKVVWDVGAHFGYHALGFAQLGAEVVAFEPNDANRTVFTQNLRRNQNLSMRIKTLPIALSDTDGDVTFMASASIGGSSSGSHLANAQSPYGDADAAQFEKTTIHASRADTIVKRGEIRPPHAVKIDVEGAEALVLQGAVETLRAHMPSLYIEMHHICAMFDVRGLLDSLGYDIKLLDAENASPSRCFIAAHANRKRT